MSARDRAEDEQTDALTSEARAVAERDQLEVGYRQLERELEELRRQGARERRPPPSPHLTAVPDSATRSRWPHGEHDHHEVNWFLRVLALTVLIAAVVALGVVTHVV